MGEFTLVLQMFGDVNAMGMVLEGQHEVKLPYLTFTMTVLKMYGKSTYTTWIRLFEERDGSTGLCRGSLPLPTGGWAQPDCIPSSHPTLRVEVYMALL